MSAASLPDWIAAIGTAGALLAAVAVLALDLRRRREELDGRRRGQAELVAAWVQGSSPAPTPGNTTYAIRIVNRSELPVYDAMLRAEWPGKVPGRHVGVGVIAPRAETTVRLDFPSYPDDANYQYVFAGTNPLVSLAFRDAAGRPWRKYGDGTFLAGYWPPEEVVQPLAP